MDTLQPDVIPIDFEKIRYEIVSIDTVVPNSYNPNYVSPENEQKLIESVQRQGFVKDVLVRELDNGTYEIIGGEHRVKILKKLGYTKVPIKNLGKISDEQAKEICLLDNSRYGFDDAIKLSDLFGSLPDAHALASFLPYSDTEIDVFLASAKVDLKELDEDPPLKLDEDLPKLPKETNKSAYRVLRFKVPIEDAQMIEDIVQEVMVAKGFTGSDSQTNAGDALILICRERRDGQV
jgi:ParB family chromosome partitioning protein